jgi:hypothetical protein
VTHTHDLTEAAEIIARSFPEVPERLRAQHTAGPDGRCVGCQWINQPQPKWPCGPRALADLAWAIQHRSERPSRR